MLAMALRIVIADDHAVQAGARGYVLKRDLSEELIDAIRQVGAGGRYLSPSVTDTMITDYLHEKKAPDALHQLSSRTIETYKARLMRKLGLTDLPAL